MSSPGWSRSRKWRYMHGDTATFRARQKKRYWEAIAAKREPGVAPWAVEAADWINKHPGGRLLLMDDEAS